MYEFFCRECNRIYTFYSRTINTEKTPPCPKCNRPDLERMISPFAVGRRSGGNGGDGETGEIAAPPIDESRMEQAIEALASEAEGIDENNPRQAATLMRKFSDLTGLKLGDKMEDAISRMEAGKIPNHSNRRWAILTKTIFSSSTKAAHPAGGTKARRARPGRNALRDVGRKSHENSHRLLFL